MKKNLFYPLLWGILTLSALSSCRTEDGAITQKQIEDKRFAVFVPKSGENINYARGFAFLMQRYDNLHKTNLSGINNNKPIIGNLNASASINQNASITQSNEVYVEFGVHTKTFTEENGDKWVIYPKVQGNKVIGLIIGALTKSETYVSYHAINPQIDFYKDNIMLFQEALDNYLKQRSRLSLSAGIKPIAEGGQKCTNDGSAFDCNIDGVVMTKEPPPPLTIITEGASDYGNSSNGGGSGGGGNGGSGTGGQCPDYLQCVNPDSNNSSDMVTIIKPKYYIRNLIEYLSILDRSKPATLRVFAEKVQIFSDNGNVGHAFISISQGGKTLTFGFYPDNPNSKFSKSLSSPGIMGDNSGSAYTHTKNYGYITSNSLGKIIDTALSYDQMRYDLAGNNCSTFVSDVLDIIYEKSGVSGMKNPDYIIYRMGGDSSMSSGTGPDTKRD